MDLQNTHPNPTYPLISLASVILAWAFKDIQVILNIMASLVAIISGLMAIKYYWASIKKIKKSKQ
jgi:hypothetical protein